LIDEVIVQAETLMNVNGITLFVTDAPNCSPPVCHTAPAIGAQLALDNMVAS
jgi:hypothetical protein